MLIRQFWLYAAPRADVSCRPDCIDVEGHKVLPRPRRYSSFQDARFVGELIYIGYGEQVAVFSPRTGDLASHSLDGYFGGLLTSSNLESSVMNALDTEGVNYKRAHAWLSAVAERIDAQIEELRRVRSEISVLLAKYEADGCEELESTVTRMGKKTSGRRLPGV